MVVMMLTLSFLLMNIFMGIAFGKTDLGKYNIDPSSLSVSGVSSGGFMAVQIHVAFSSIFSKGAGIIAGGPFYCANDNVEIALHACMTDPELISVTELVTITYNTASMDFISSPKHLADSKVYIFSGSEDTIVHQGVSKKLNEYYGHFVNKENIVTEFSVPAQHSWVTDSYGNSCDYKGSPYINNCSYDTAGALLNHIYENKLNNKTQSIGSNLNSFDQSDYLPLMYKYDPHAIGMDNLAYVYVPSECQDGTTICKLHVVFHGCEQSISKIGTKFVSNVGVNEWAEANKIIVLYPQAHENILNPKGCWDWWGYTGTDYASNLGFQMLSVKNMVKRISGT